MRWFLLDEIRLGRNLMVNKLVSRILVMWLVGITLISACNALPPQATLLPQGRTGIDELDTIISTVLNGSRSELIPLLGFTQTSCTFAEGLGGPPKCMDGEKEGTPLEVLPFLGPGEGSFIRKQDIGSWSGLEVSELYAAYQVSDKAYSEKDYPAGDYALVFIDSNNQGGITLQVRDGRIIRIDYSFGYPPEISQENVVQFLTAPIEVDQ
jgi:hypothetical protein